MELNPETKPRVDCCFVANKGDQTLGIIDPVAAQQIATIAENGVTGP